MAPEHGTQGFYQRGTKIEDNWKQILFVKREHLCAHVGLNILF